MKVPDPRTQSIVHEKVLTASELKHLKESFEVREWVASKELTKDEMLEQIGELWNFPSYFGKNWDALIDCLSDLSWFKHNRFAFVIQGLGSGEEWDVLLECLEEVSQRWRNRMDSSCFITVLVAQ